MLPHLFLLHCTYCSAGWNAPSICQRFCTYDTTGNLLTAYDGESITYDVIGNPTSYYNGNRWTFGWENGRQLTSLSKQPPVIITTQPENYFGTVGGTATFTVAAEGDRVTYQWQRSTDDGETWSNISGGTSAAAPPPP